MLGLIMLGRGVNLVDFRVSALRPAQIYGIDRVMVAVGVCWCSVESGTRYVPQYTPEYVLDDLS